MDEKRRLRVNPQKKALYKNFLCGSFSLSNCIITNKNNAIMTKLRHPVSRKKPRVLPKRRFDSWAKLWALSPKLRV